jgi:hypothetical protein
MSIAKTGANKSASSLMDYLLDKSLLLEKEPEIIGGNVLGETKQEIKDEFREQEDLNFRVKNKVSHFSISFPNNQEVSNETAADYADLLMEALGYVENPYLVVRHYDKEKRKNEPYAHIHIAASRINNDGSLIPEWKIAERLIESVKELDKVFKLESSQYIRIEQGEKVERSIKKDEYQVMQRTGNISVLEEFKQVAERTLSEINNPLNEKFEIQRSLFEPSKLETFVEKIEEKGFEVLPNISFETGEMKGFSFKKDKIIFTASRAGKQFKWINLAEKTDYYEPRDQGFLKSLRLKVIENNQNTVSSEEEKAKISIENSREKEQKLIEKSPIVTENDQTKIERVEKIHEKNNENNEIKLESVKENNEKMNNSLPESPVEISNNEVENDEKYVSNHSTQNQKLAEIAVQFINVRYFAANLDGRIINEWIENTSEKNAEAIYKRLIEAKTIEDEKVILNFLFRVIDKITKDLQLPAPKVIEETNEINKNLYLIQAKVELSNYAKVNELEDDPLIIAAVAQIKKEKADLKLQDKNRIYNPINQSIAAEKTNQISKLTQEENKQQDILADIFKAIPYQLPNFRNEEELKTFNALMRPKAVGVEENISKIANFVGKERAAATELVNIIQIAYGGQSHNFTKEVKQEIANNLYKFYPFKVNETYNKYKNEDREKISEASNSNYFHIIVKASCYEHLGREVSTFNGEFTIYKNLADDLSEKVISRYEKHTGEQLKVNERIKIENELRNLKHHPVFEEQKQDIHKFHPKKLEPPKLKNCLEATYHNWQHRSEEDKLKRSLNYVREMKKEIKKESVIKIEEKLISTRNLKM